MPGSMSDDTRRSHVRPDCGAARKRHPPGRRDRLGAIRPALPARPSAPRRKPFGGVALRNAGKEGIRSLSGRSRGNCEGLNILLLVKTASLVMIAHSSFSGTLGNPTPGMFLISNLRKRGNKPIHCQEPSACHRT